MTNVTITYDLSTRALGAELPSANFPPDAGSNSRGSLSRCEEHATDALGTGWHCTRREGHTGMHVARFDPEGGTDMVGLAWRTVEQ